MHARSLPLCSGREDARRVPGEKRQQKPFPGDTRVRTKEKERAKKSFPDPGETPDGPTGEEDSVAGEAGEGEARGWRGAWGAVRSGGRLHFLAKA